MTDCGMWNFLYQVWFSSFCCNLVFFSIGIIGCMAFAPYLAGVASNNVRS